jgi:hypothetical protein
MSKRNEWKFMRKAQDILSGADSKLAHHKSRLEFWVSMKAETLTKIKEDGLEISDSLAAGVWGAGVQQLSNAANRGAQVLVRAEYQNDLNECHAKINEHQHKIQSYSSWVQFLSGPTPVEVEMDIDDHLFFFGE